MDGRMSGDSRSVKLTTAERDALAQLAQQQATNPSFPERAFAIVAEHTNRSGASASSSSSAEASAVALLDMKSAKSLQAREAYADALETAVIAAAEAHTLRRFGYGDAVAASAAHHGAHGANKRHRDGGDGTMANGTVTPLDEYMSTLLDSSQQHLARLPVAASPGFVHQYQKYAHRTTVNEVKALLGELHRFPTDADMTNHVVDNAVKYIATRPTRREALVFLLVSEAVTITAQVQQRFSAYAGSDAVPPVVQGPLQCAGTLRVRLLLIVFGLFQVDVRDAAVPAPRGRLVDFGLYTEVFRVLIPAVVVQLPSEHREVVEIVRRSILDTNKIPSSSLQ